MSEWHLRKEVTVGNIVASILLIAAAIAAFHNLDTRVVKLEANAMDAEIHRAEEKAERKEDIARLCERLDRIQDLQIQVLRKIGE